LLPVHSFGTEYRVVSRPELVGGGPWLQEGDQCLAICQPLPGGYCDYDDLGEEFCVVPYRGSFTVVASEADTTVSVVPTAPTLPGDGVPAMQPGETHTFTLQPYQMLNVKTVALESDFTGTHVTSDRPIAVFGGHESSNTGDVCCTDHLEAQLLPVRSWGKEVIATKSFARGQEGDYYRIVAAEDATVVQFEPAVHDPASLDAGQWLEVHTVSDFRISADKPILVAQVLASSDETLSVPAWSLCISDFDCHSGYACTSGYCYPPLCSVAADCPYAHSCECIDDWGCYCRPVGDPALIVLAPVEQFRDEYVFLTPNKYVSDYVNVIAPADATVTFDGSPIPDFQYTPIPSSTYRVARLLVSDGVHHLVSSAPTGVVVYGYDADVSYGYVGGLDLEAL
ncbi:MAG: IgGFc-binding protein, partial [Myxococcota bacterium]|nr:IgGFc-binding protein [Myxococcota bacterium]